MGTLCKKTKKIIKPGLTIFIITSITNIILHFYLMFFTNPKIKQLLLLELKHHIAFGSALSSPAALALLITGILAVCFFFAWFNIKENDQEINTAENDTNSNNINYTLQEITKFIIQNINTNNIAILQWLEEKRQKGQQVPLAVENASNNIARVIRALTEAVYLIPYSEEYKHLTPEEIASIIQDKIINSINYPKKDAYVKKITQSNAYQ